MMRRHVALVLILAVLAFQPSVAAQTPTPSHFAYLPLILSPERATVTPTATATFTPTGTSTSTATEPVTGTHTPTWTRTPTATSFPPDWAVCLHVVDGDTIELSTGQRVRYIGINTPETGDCYGTEATNKNRELVEGKIIRLEKDVSETDQYGRLLRYVYVVYEGGLFVNAELVRQGYAQVATYPPDVRYADHFLQLEQEAREAGRGLWSACATPTPTATWTPTVSPPEVRVASWCCQFDVPGNDNQNLNEEYVCFENRGGGTADISDWHVRDAVNTTYTFPTFTLASRASVRLRTGTGTNTATDVYWGRGNAVWINDGDSVYLYDAAWNLVDRYDY